MSFFKVSHYSCAFTSQGRDYVVSIDVVQKKSVEWKNSNYELGPQDFSLEWKSDSQIIFLDDRDPCKDRNLVATLGIISLLHDFPFF